MAKLARTSFGHLLQKTFEEIRTTIRFASILGVKHRILLRPWLGNHDLFKDGILFEVTKGLKRSDVIASGGRYVSPNGVRPLSKLFQLRSPTCQVPPPDK